MRRPIVGSVGGPKKELFRLLWWRLLVHLDEKLIMAQSEHLLRLIWRRCAARRETGWLTDWLQSLILLLRWLSKSMLLCCHSICLCWRLYISSKAYSNFNGSQSSKWPLMSNLKKNTTAYLSTFSFFSSRFFASPLFYFTSFPPLLPVLPQSHFTINFLFYSKNDVCLFFISLSLSAFCILD